MELRNLVLQCVKAIPTFRFSMPSPSSGRITRNDYMVHYVRLAATAKPKVAHSVEAAKMKGW
jgi:hypothetical protein